MKRKLKKGFTLIELMVVIAIIGILGTVLTPKIREQLAKSKDAKAVQFLGAVRTAASALTINDSLGDTDQNGIEGIWESKGGKEGLKNEIDMSIKGMIDSKSGEVIIGGHRENDKTSAKYGGEVFLVNAVDGTRDTSILEQNQILLKDDITSQNPQTVNNGIVQSDDTEYADDVDLDEIPDSFTLNVDDESDEPAPSQTPAKDPDNHHNDGKENPLINSLASRWYHGNLADSFEDHPLEAEKALKDKTMEFCGESYREVIEKDYIPYLSQDKETNNLQIERLRRILSGFDKNGKITPTSGMKSQPLPQLTPQLIPPHTTQATPTKTQQVAPQPKPTIKYPVPPIVNTNPKAPILIKNWNDLHLMFSEKIDETSVEGKKWMDY